MDEIDDRVELSCEVALQHFSARGLFLFVEIRRSFGKLAPIMSQRRPRLPCVQERRDLVHEVIAGRAVDAPGRQLLIAGENVLDHEVRREGALLAPRLQRRAERRAIAGGIGETVDMIDPQAVDQPLFVELQRQAMHLVERLRPLDANAGQSRDLEETAIVDEIVGRAPTGQPIVLRFKQRVQSARIACGFDPACPESWLIDPAQRETMLVVVDREFLAALAPSQHKFPLLQGVAIGGAEQRHEEFAVQAGRGEIDVEEIGVGAVAAILQQIEPVGVVAAADRHVIGDDVEDDADARFAQSRRHGAEAVFAAEFGIDAGEVRDVVAVHRAGGRLHDRREIEMRDAESPKIFRPRGGGGKIEILVKLKTIGRGDGGVEIVIHSRARLVR